MTIQNQLHKIDWVFVAAILGLLFGNYLLAIMLNVNLFLFYGVTGQGLGFDRSIFGIDSSLIFALINITIYGNLLYELYLSIDKVVLRNSISRIVLRKQILKSSNKSNLHKIKKGTKWKH